MRTPIPTAGQYMHPSPHSVGKDQTLDLAHGIMRRHKIRHLPVLDGGVLVGLVSERDLHLVETLRDVNPAEVLVEEAMSTNVYTTSPDTPLDEVLTVMADKKLGCAVMVHDHRVVGLLTTVDVCRVLAALLRSQAAS